MVLIIGGQAQGKLAHGRTLAGPGRCWDGETCPLTAAELTAEPVALLNRLHLLVLRCIREGGDPVRLLDALETASPELVVICDEIGCGIVPMEREQRDWREQTGRLCCRLAARARRVDRVFCGCAQTIKG